MNYLLILLFFLLGLTLGSFFNVIGLRVPQQQPFVNERSICPNCGHQLLWHELIPVLSYIHQRGRCNVCAKRISPVYPFIELSTALLFVLCYMTFGFHPELITSLFFVSLLLVTFVSDINYMLIPDQLLGFFLPCLIISRVIQPLDPWWSSVIGALTGVIVIAAIILLSRGGMGAGDMKLFAVVGIVLGFDKTLLAFFLSCVIGALFGSVLMVLKKIGRMQPVPFAPFIVIASLIVYFQGDALLDWYLTSMF